jgi:cysteine desulfurase
MTPIYLDYNATTPIDSQVAEAMLPYIHGLYGNPSSGHAFGLEARAGVDRARHQVASMLGCHDDEVLFTSGGTESDNHAIKGALLGPIEPKATTSSPRTLSILLSRRSVDTWKFRA